MIDTQKITAYCLKKENSILDFPFGEEPACLKVFGRLFAALYKKDGEQVTLKCEPTLAQLFREQYPDTVFAGYHFPTVQKRYWNTIYLNKSVDDELIYQMIDHSYLEVLKKVPKRLKGSNQ